MMTDEQVLADGAGAIVFDARRAPQARADWFEPAFWRAQGALEGLAGGRGGVGVVRTPAGEGVLRHYRRGGMVARLLGDRYLWTGADRTRGFREYRLLASLHGQGLPVPAPIGARYVRHGLRYSADLLTARIPDAPTLAQYLGEGQLDAAVAGQVGAAVARFHRVGAWHADLNAHNILVAPSGIFVIDFDRGRLRAPQRSWQQSNLERLRRSLLKLGAGIHGIPAFDAAIWAPLLDDYERTLGA
jgi:3-deoxy-D-manno-octulosonic acid kinase